MATYDEEELVTRAIRAYFTRMRREGIHSPAQPANTSGLRTYGGREFVVLENINGPQAVYKVKDNGRIEYVEYSDWPVGLSMTPPGRPVEELVAEAVEILARHKPEALAGR